VAAGLTGCVTRDFSMHNLPAQTAADSVAAGSTSARDAGTPAAAPAASPAAPANMPPGEALTSQDAPPMYTYDPWERLNRATYRFNARVDENVILPVANQYRRLPGPLRSGVHNFFANLGEVDSVVNYGLQLRLLNGARALGRFVINSTLGIGGLLDVATHLQLTNPSTGFSATLSTWGMHPGPFLVIPLLGPATLRDALGSIGDYGIVYGINLADLYRGNKSYALGTVNSIDTRSSIGFRYYATASPFEYDTVRFLYVRKELIEDETLRRFPAHRSRDRTAPAGK
jgi:phospholipid-binding lipoprotein MlaA